MSKRAREETDDHEATPEEAESPPPHVRRLSTPPPAAIVITCDIPPICKSVPFTSYDEYEAHYAQIHTNRCSECHHNFPSRRYLEVHIRECHDTLAQLRKERGERIYECYVDGCDKVCLTRGKRKMHLIDKHKFPKDFYWAIIDKGLDNRKTLLNSPHIEADTGLPLTAARHLQVPAPTKPNPQNDRDGMESISSLMGSLKLVPRSVQLRK